jgi:hypothetical protein
MLANGHARSHIPSTEDGLPMKLLIPLAALIGAVAIFWVDIADRTLTYL